MSCPHNTIDCPCIKDCPRHGLCCACVAHHKQKGNELPQGYIIARALDEITSMKILSRIEGDDTKVKESMLENLTNTIKEALNEIAGEENPVESVSIAKLKEMKERLNSGYTSFWS